MSSFSPTGLKRSYTGPFLVLHSKHFKSYMSYTEAKLLLQRLYRSISISYKVCRIYTQALSSEAETLSENFADYFLILFLINGLRL